MTIEPNRGRTAVVLGGSIAGIFAARVLAEHVERVVLVERDAFPEEPENRSGVPQGRQYHIMLLRGIQIVQELFPGLIDELKQAGAVEFDYGADLRFNMRGVWVPQEASGITLFSLKRTLWEHGLRRRLFQDCPNVERLEQTKVIGLLGNEKRVAGVRLDARTGEQQELRADFIVDATGRNSQTSDWLQSMGYGDVRTTIINPFLGYVTRRYKKPQNWQSDWKMMLITGYAPDKPQGGLIFEEDDGNWCIMMAGANKEYPPTDDDGFLAYAQRVHPEFAEVVAQAEPISPAYGYRRTENFRRHYEEMARWPDNFIVMGDAVCAFDPIYGQGMAGAGMAALELQSRLQANQGALQGIAPDVQKKIGAVIDPIWTMVTSVDLQWPLTEGGSGDDSLSARFGRWYFDRVMDAVPLNLAVRTDLTKVLQLTEPVESLLKPATMVRAFWYWLRYRGKPPA